MKSTLTVTHPMITAITKEVELPYYFFNSSDRTYSAITGEKNNLTCYINSGKSRASINQFGEASTLLLDSCKEITQDEFIAAYEIASVIITEQFLTACPSVKPPLAVLNETGSIYDHSRMN